MDALEKHTVAYKLTLCFQAHHGKPLQSVLAMMNCGTDYELLRMIKFMQKYSDWLRSQAANTEDPEVRKELFKLAGTIKYNLEASL